MRRCAILGNRRAMKPLAVMDRDQRTERAALLGANHRRAGSSGARLLPTIVLGLPKRSQEMTQKTQGTTRTPSRRGFLNRIFTITPTTSPRGLLAPELSRQEARRLLSAGRRAMKANSSISQSTPGRARGRRRSCRSGQPIPVFSLNMPGSGMAEDGSCEG